MALSERAKYGIAVAIVVVLSLSIFLYNPYDGLLAFMLGVVIVVTLSAFGILNLSDEQAKPFDMAGLTARQKWRIALTSSGAIAAYILILLGIILFILGGGNALLIPGAFFLLLVIISATLFVMQARIACADNAKLLYILPVVFGALGGSAFVAIAIIKPGFGGQFFGIFGVVMIATAWLMLVFGETTRRHVQGI